MVILEDVVFDLLRGLREALDSGGSASVPTFARNAQLLLRDGEIPALDF